MQVDRSNVTEMREDVSRFVVHLTRDNTADFPDSGGTARDNFLAILREREILAVRPHCLHLKEVRQLSPRQRKSFRVACFTEVPLSQIRYLVGSIRGRSIELEPYGFVFNKKFLIGKSAQPALYINSYSHNRHLRDAVDRIFSKAKDEGFTGKIWRLLPFISAMHES